MIYRNIELNWLGHAGFKLKSASGQRAVYIDPFKINVDSEIEAADFIFITHSHYDHCSIEDIKKILKPETIIVCTPDCQSKFRHVGDNIKITLAEPGTRMEFLDGALKFWAVPAYNISKRFHSREEDWVGYIIEIDGVLVYHAGDTDFILEMKQIKGVDIALLPVGGNFTMNAGEAAKAAALIKPKLAVPMHYGEIAGNADDARLFLKYCSAEGVEAKVLDLEN